jgi:hypothetical protein
VAAMVVLELLVSFANKNTAVRVSVSINNASTPALNLFQPQTNDLWGLICGPKSPTSRLSQGRAKEERVVRRKVRGKRGAK